MLAAIRQLGSNTLYAILALVLVLVVFYYWLDIPVIYWVTQHIFFNGWLTSISLACARIFVSINWVIIAIIAGIIGIYLYYFKRHTHHAKPLLFFSAATLVAFVFCSALKFILARYRPEMLLDHGVYGLHFFSYGNLVNSMPSGHATMAFAGFYALSRICNRSWITCIFMALATIIAVSRIIILAHYPGDIIFGALLGLLCVIWVQTIMRYHQEQG